MWAIWLIWWPWCNNWSRIINHQIWSGWQEGRGFTVIEYVCAYGIQKAYKSKFPSETLIPFICFSLLSFFPLSFSLLSPSSRRKKWWPASHRGGAAAPEPEKRFFLYIYFLQFLVVLRFCVVDEFDSCRFGIVSVGSFWLIFILVGKLQVYVCVVNWLWKLGMMNCVSV